MNAQRKSSLRIKILLSCVWLLIFWFCFSPAIRLAQASITLTYFNATWQNDDVLVSWETAAEEDIEGFYIQRSESQNGNYSRVSTRIPSIGDPQSGAFYQFIDSDATSGMTYWYRLESIENVDETEVSVYYEPVMAVLYQQTPTATNTGTLESTPTQTNTPATPLAGSETPTVTGTPAQALPTATSPAGTVYPAPFTVTPPANLPTSSPLQPTQPQVQPLLPTPGVLTPTGTSLSPTETLIPLPDITLTFPPGGIIIQERGAIPPTPAPASQSAGAPGWNPYGGVMLISVIVVIWILLGSWFYLAFRKIE